MTTSRGAALVLVWVLGIGASAQADPWRFVVTGDTRSNSSSDNNGVNVTIVHEIADAVVAEQAKFVLMTGDLVYAGSTSGAFTTWKNAMAPAYNAGIGVYPVIGNHDSSGVSAWVAAFGADLPDNGPAGEVNRTFSFTYNNALIIGLDEYVTSHRVNQTWLNTQLAANQQPHVFVFGHEPAFEVSHADCLNDYPANRNAFWNSLAAAGGRTYFAGHDHFYDRMRLDDGDGNPADDLYQYIVGTGGAPLTADSDYSGDVGSWTPFRAYHEQQYGYVLVEIDGPNVTMTWKHRVSPGVYAATPDVMGYTAVPEPVSLALVALGVLLLGRSRR